MLFGGKSSSEHAPVQICIFEGCRKGGGGGGVIESCKQSCRAEMILNLLKGKGDSCSVCGAMVATDMTLTV